MRQTERTDHIRTTVSRGCHCSRGSQRTKTGVEPFTRGQTGRELYMPMNSAESPVNRLTSSHTDPITNTPAYKETSVHLNVLPEIGESPLPRINSRFGHPTPQNGVEVERKWKRPDYAPPGNGLVHLQTKKR
jgi:predicted molibdopterin-dependent oxidoreductase YjgC